jgi:hypothetical protein
MSTEDSAKETGGKSDAPQEIEAYERAKQQALKFLRKGFHMGGHPLMNRDELHERRKDE